MSLFIRYFLFNTLIHKIDSARSIILKELFAMNNLDVETNSLFETIKKELNVIINDSPNASGGSTITSTDSFNKKPINKAQQHADLSTLGSNNETDITNQTRFLEGPIQHNIDMDIKKMQTHLRQTYELFHSIGDKFEAIDFSSLKTRIEDLRLKSVDNNEYGENQRLLERIFEENYMSNRLDKLTTDVNQTFRKHSGEFGDIPEISAFFQSCSQLQHGLEALKGQRNDVKNLWNRVHRANTITHNRIDEIGKIMSKDLGIPGNEKNLKN